jgi:hypothetical protein
MLPLPARESIRTTVERPGSGSLEVATCADSSRAPADEHLWFAKTHRS